MPTPPNQSSTLRDVLRATPRLAPERAATLLAGLARALSGRATPYPGLSPERVVVGAGDAVAVAPPPATPGAPAPWPAYLAPEQIDGRSGDARSDVYALGLLGWEMLAGQQPWEGESLYGIVVKQREQDLPRLSTLRPGLPRPLVQAVEGALHKAPGDRWQSPAEFLAALAPVLAAAPTGPAASPPPVARPTRPAPEPVRVADEDAEPAYAAPVAAARRGRDPRPAERPRRRWLTVTALTLALLAASAGAYAVVQGRQASSETRAWLDSLTTAGGTPAAAVPAATTRENTTSVPVRRSRGAPEAPVILDEQVDSSAAAILEPTEPTEPVLEPTPPLVPGAAPRVLRPTVPRPTVPRLPADTGAGRDTLTPPEPPTER